MKTPQNKLYPTREQYLLAAVELCKPLFAANGNPLPAVHVSTGWPSTRGTAAKRKALGECWDKNASADEVAQVFVSPFMEQPIHLHKTDGQGMIPTLIHELVHVAVGNKAGHGKPFRKLAVALGLEGKMTSTVAGPGLIAQLENDFLPKLGAYPHAKLNPNARSSGPKKQGTRMIKCSCDDCGYTVRTSQKWLDLSGPPICPCNKKTMGLEGDDE
jgi:hypothetical protein